MVMVSGVAFSHPVWTQFEAQHGHMPKILFITQTASTGARVRQEAARLWSGGLQVMVSGPDILDNFETLQRTGADVISLFGLERAPDMQLKNAIRFVKETAKGAIVVGGLGSRDVQGHTVGLRPQLASFLGISSWSELKGQNDLTVRRGNAVSGDIGRDLPVTLLARSNLDLVATVQDATPLAMVDAPNPRPYLTCREDSVSGSRIVWWGIDTLDRGASANDQRKVWDLWFNLHLYVARFLAPVRINQSSGLYNSTFILRTDDSMPRWYVDFLIEKRLRNATFFATNISSGDYIPPVAERYARDKGFEIADHTLSHKDLTKLPTEQIRSEIAGQALYLQRVTQSKILGFAAPFNSYDDRIMLTISQSNLTYFSGDAVCSALQSIRGACSYVYVTFPRNVVIGMPFANKTLDLMEIDANFAWYPYVNATVTERNTNVTKFLIEHDSARKVMLEAFAAGFPYVLESHPTFFWPYDQDARRELLGRLLREVSSAGYVWTPSLDEAIAHYRALWSLTLKYEVRGNEIQISMDRPWPGFSLRVYGPVPREVVNGSSRAYPDGYTVVEPSHTNVKIILAQALDMVHIVMGFVGVTAVVAGATVVLLRRYGNKRRMLVRSNVAA
jgi:peptidoglycan/xylan/chitin deacetylase (PgdA/CDA1 family)